MRTCLLACESAERQVTRSDDDVLVSDLDTNGATNYTVLQTASHSGAEIDAVKRQAVVDIAACRRSELEAFQSRRKRINHQTPIRPA